MTTDTVKKEAAVETIIGGKTVRLGGIAKGSGMIHPNMGTMLCFLTTDCAISPEMIKAALLETVQVSFNRISVDGDTSTNDSCMRAGQRPGGQRAHHGQGRGLSGICGGAQDPVHPACQEDGLRRRGRQAPHHLHGHRCQE